ncbi:MAG: glycosyltransferase family 2 protein [Gemmataceae bacterium]|nr:glycosyltransferase family 2 protein [Gemmataceae bacterium]
MAIAAWCLAAILSVPFVWLAVECLAALLPARRRANSAARPRVAVLVPAHNEEAGIASTLRDILPQLAPVDQLLVIADNCADTTAAVARAAGAEVYERRDDVRRGKGYALDFGIRQLTADPPGVLIVIDADTRTQPGTIDALARAVASTGRAAQATNLLEPPAGAGPGARLSAFAFFFRNAIRTRGMDRLGLPCLLYGTGMALPYAALARIDLANGDITEDMRLGIDLAVQGTPPMFVPEAGVRGTLPGGASAATSQRRRWEHGHMATIARTVPRLLVSGLVRPRLLGLALHLGVPPLALLALLGVGGVALFAVLGQWQPAAMLLGAMTAALLGLLMTWAVFARDRLPARDLILLPVYVLRKVPIYLGFIFRRQKAWVRTEREVPAGK